MEVGKKANRYYASFAGDLTDTDKGEMTSAEQIDLSDKCDWADVPF